MQNISAGQVRSVRKRTQAPPWSLTLAGALWLFLFSPSPSAQDLLIMAPDLPGASEEGGVGRDAEIVRQVLELCGYEPEFVVHPFGRHLRTYTEVQRYDAVMTVPLSAKLGGEATAAYVWHQNGAFYDASRISKIESVRNLAGLHVVTFRDGIEMLELDDVAPDTASVLEIADLRVHSKLLLLGRVDAILADGMIIAEVNRRYMESADFRNKYGSDVNLRFAPIFLPLPYKMVFRDPAMAGEFDQCFDAARSGRLIYKINERYLGPLQKELRHTYMGL